MRRVSEPRDAVVAMDMTAAAELVSRAELRAFLATRRSWRRSTRVAWAVALASERSLSPNEVRMRLVWELDAGLPRPLVNQPVWSDTGHLLGVADIFDPVAGVVGEYDGGTHLAMGRRAKDVHREDHFRRAGLEYFTVTGPDLFDTRKIVERMLATRARAPYFNGRLGTWTIQPPDGWWFTVTAADRLASRDRWLGLDTSA
jgi:hypothetical protein